MHFPTKLRRSLFGTILPLRNLCAICLISCTLLTGIWTSIQSGWVLISIPIHFRLLPMDRCNQGSKRQRSRAAALGSAVENEILTPKLYFYSSLTIGTSQNASTTSATNATVTASHAHAHVGLACARACWSRVCTPIFSRAGPRKPTGIAPGPFWGWELADVTNQARLCMHSACLCMLWPSPVVLLRIRLPVHRSLCASFSLSDALLVQNGPLHSGCAPPNGALCLLGCAPLFSVWFLVLLTERPESFETDLPSSTFGCLPVSIFQSGPFK